MKGERGTKKRTSNVQRSTSNVQRGERVRRTGALCQFGGKRKKIWAGRASAKYDLEESLLEFAARLIKLVDSLPKYARGESHRRSIITLWYFAVCKSWGSASCGVAEGFYP